MIRRALRRLLGIKSPSAEILRGPAIEYLREAELQGHLAALYAAHPGLREAEVVLRSVESCPCCVTSRLGERFGWGVAQDLDALRFLLGMDR